MHCFKISGSLSAAQTFSFGAGMRWLSFICMIKSLSAGNGIGRALAAAAFDGDFGEDRHRDLLRRDRAEIETRRGLDAIDRLARDAAGDKLFAERDHLAAAADEGVI